MNKKKPQDLTIRDRRAANKRFAKLSERVKKLETEQKRQDKVLKSLVKNFEELIVT